MVGPTLGITTLATATGRNQPHSAQFVGDEFVESHPALAEIIAREPLILQHLQHAEARAKVTSTLVLGSRGQDRKSANQGETFGSVGHVPSVGHWSPD